MKKIIVNIIISILLCSCTSQVSSIDKKINKLSDTIEQKRALIQLVKSIENTLTIDVYDETELKKSSDTISRANQCINLMYLDIQERIHIIETIEENVLNTKEKKIKYNEFNNKLSGTISPLLSGNTCD